MSGLVQILTQLGQTVVQFVVSNPHLTRGLLLAGDKVREEVVQYYRRLPPEDKRKVDDAIRWATKQAIKLGLRAVIGDLAELVVAAGGDQVAVEFAVKVVEHGVEVGIEKALDEARATPPGEAFLPPLAPPVTPPVLPPVTVPKLVACRVRRHAEPLVTHLDNWRKKRPRRRR